MNSIIAMCISFGFLMILFYPMEKMFPFHQNQKILRKNWLLDLTYFAGQYILWSGIVYYCVQFIGQYVSSTIPINLNQIFENQSFYVQVVVLIFISDIMIYWGHRLQHRIDFLWRFHKIHHSAEKLDWLAAHREHPIDSIYTITIINLPAFVFGFDLTVLSSVIAFRGLWAIFIHSNIYLNLNYVKWFIGSPDLHHWHHCKSRYVGNYANISPLMDIIFGTYVSKKETPKEYGLKNKINQSYVAQMVGPILPSKISQSLFSK